MLRSGYALPTQHPDNGKTTTSTGRGSTYPTPIPVQTNPASALAWPANIFDTPFLAWDTAKTDAPVTIPWSMVPPLRERIEAAKLRHQQAPIRGTTFFVDDVGQRPWNSNRFYSAFNKLRSALGKRHESFVTRYAIKHYPGAPMRMPTTWLTMRVLRHTCITALHDAGCVREQIRAITGHSIASINEVLDRYTRLTADQAGAALARRLAHESPPAGGGVTPLKTFVEGG